MGKFVFLLFIWKKSLLNIQNNSNYHSRNENLLDMYVYWCNILFILVYLYNWIKGILNRDVTVKMLKLVFQAKATKATFGNKYSCVCANS